MTNYTSTQETQYESKPSYSPNQRTLEFMNESTEMSRNNQPRKKMSGLKKLVFGLTGVFILGLSIGIYNHDQYNKQRIREAEFKREMGQQKDDDLFTLIAKKAGEAHEFMFVEYPKQVGIRVMRATIESLAPEITKSAIENTTNLVVDEIGVVVGNNNKENKPYENQPKDKN